MDISEKIKAIEKYGHHEFELMECLARWKEGGNISDVHMIKYHAERIIKKHEQ